MRRNYLLGTLIVSLGLGIGLTLTTVPAHAMATFDQSSAALAAPVAQRPLDDQQVHFVPVPSHYAQAANPHGINTIASNRGAAVKFTTKYLLPTPGYRHEAWGDPQSMTVVGRYLYILYCPTAWHNRGRIVRYDMEKLSSLGATPQQLQRVYTTAANQSAKERQLRTAIKVGPVFVTGHGQSLAFDWKTHQLYMWCDRESAPRIPINQYGYLQQVSAATLSPVHRIRFRLRAGDFSVPGGHVLAFDRQGRAYFWSRPDAGGAYIYQGKIRRDHVDFRLTSQELTHAPGTCVQSMAFNPQNDRLYLVADESIASLPVAKLAGRGHLTSHDVTWTHFASKREFEGLSFGQDGRAYLLSNHQPEVLVGNTLSW